MKKITILIFSMLAMIGVGCTNYLDINTNPNQAVTATPGLVLPQALVATALNLNGPTNGASDYNSYGAQLGGYAANAGGYGGFNELVSYRYTSANYAALWSDTYDNLEDYQYIINNTTGSYPNLYYNAVATIMRVYNFQLLVDTYNDVPYSQALQGSANLAPAYDKGATIYAGLAVELDSAMARINKGLSATVSPTPIASADALFGGNMTSWLQLANTIKLRLVIRGGSKVTFANTSFDPMGFLTTDALINPSNTGGTGFARDNNRQNPAWNTYGWTYQGAAARKSWIPTTWMMSFYNGKKLTDYARGLVCYYHFKRKSFGVTVYGDSISNQLGDESNTNPACPSGSFWYSGTNRTGTAAGNSVGILKGPTAGVPMFTAAESYFLQAEAAVIGLAIPGGAGPSASFNNGIVASFNYLYQMPNGTVVGDPAGDAATYIANNAGNYLVDFTAANTTDKQLEAIITQKYIALNFVESAEGWNEYRRTGYPKVSGTSATTTFASIVSQSTRPDRLPARILYPSTETTYNPANVPQGIDVFNSTIFWAK